MRRADVDVRSWSPCVCGRGRAAPEAVELVLIGDGLGVAEVLHQLEAVADREQLDRLDVLEIIDELLQLSRILDDILVGISRGFYLLEDLRPGSFSR